MKTDILQPFRCTTKWCADSLTQNQNYDPET